MGYFQYYQGTDQQWYWRLRDENHRSIAIGGEGYVTETGVLRAIDNVKRSMPR
jgi:uncharacterized protein YegP (UPF0339 family)